MNVKEFYQSLRLGQRLPALGIIAFSLCSINSVASLFLSRASNPTPILWVAAGLVEIVTAWIVYQVVETLRKVTKSNISKQDRKFYGLVLALFTILAIPPLALSVTANALEFGDVALGSIFPLLSVACAVGSALPQTVQKFETQSQAEKALRAAERTQRKADRDREKAEADAKIRIAEAEARTQEAEARIAEAERTQREADEAQRDAGRQQRLDSLGANARQILGILDADGPQSQADIAQRLGVKRQTVAHHMRRLEGLELISNGKVLVELGGNGAGQ